MEPTWNTLEFLEHRPHLSLRAEGSLAEADVGIFELLLAGEGNVRWLFIVPPSSPGLDLPERSRLFSVDRNNARLEQVIWAEFTELPDYRAFKSRTLQLSKAAKLTAPVRDTLPLPVPDAPVLLMPTRTPEKVRTTRWFSTVR